MQDREGCRLCVSTGECMSGIVCACKHAFVWWGLCLDAFGFAKAVEKMQPDSSIVFRQDMSRQHSPPAAESTTNSLFLLFFA